MTDTVIRTDNLTRHFGKKTALDGLNLNVRRGEVYGLLGHNGAGKTTTVRLLNGLLRPDGGAARVLGLDPVAQGDALRPRTGVLTETPGLEERLTARQNLAYFAELYGVPQGAARQRAERLLDAFDLSEVGDQRVAGFSKGMKQRLAVARALLHEPELLFLDEPTSGLDPLSARMVNATIARLSRSEGRTVVLCTHDLTDAQALCDRVSILRAGRVAQSGTLAELSARMGLQPRVTIEVGTGHTRQASDLLASHFGARVEPTAAGLQVEGLRHEDVPHALRALCDAGVDVFAVTPHGPTLEDAYVSVHAAPAPGAA